MIDSLSLSERIASWGNGLLASCEPGQHKGHGIGFISSVAYSPELAKNIGLGFVSGGLSRQGDLIDAVSPLRGEVAVVRVVAPHFVDPDGVRVNG